MLCLLLYGTRFSKYHFGKGYFTMVKPQSNFTKIKIISGPISEFLARGSRNTGHFMSCPFPHAGFLWFPSCTSFSLPLSPCPLRCACAPPRHTVCYRPKSCFCRGHRVTRIHISGHMSFLSWHGKSS